MADLKLRADAAGAKDAITEVLAGEGFRISWDDARTGKAERGKLSSNVMLGAFAQYLAIGIEVHPASDGTTVRLVQQNTGMAGGLASVIRARRQFRAAADRVAARAGERELLIDYLKG